MIHTSKEIMVTVPGTDIRRTEGRNNPCTYRYTPSKAKKITTGIHMMMSFNIDNISQGSRRQLTLQQDPISMKISMKIFNDEAAIIKMEVNSIFSPNPLRKSLRFSRVDFAITCFLCSFSNNSCINLITGCIRDSSSSMKKETRGGVMARQDRIMPITPAACANLTDRQLHPMAKRFVNKTQIFSIILVTTCVD